VAISESTNAIIQRVLVMVVEMLLFPGRSGFYSNFAFVFRAMDVKEIFSVTLILFSVIDIIGAVPFIILIKQREGRIHAEKATIISAVLMVGFLFLGQSILKLFGLDVSSFAVAGSIVIFIVAMEMILGITLIKDDPDSKGTGSIVPLAFPLIAGAGTLTTILSLRAVYSEVNVLIGILVNLIFVYWVLRSSGWLERVIGKSGFAVLRRVFGVILLAIAVKIFKSNALL
jgi:multiple antibiotic resistance protein